MSVEIGHRLKQARESQGKTLEQLEHETRIPAAYLAAIEAGEFDRIPNSYYVRSYLRIFAKSVGENPQSIMILFRKTGQGRMSQASIGKGHMQSEMNRSSQGYRVPGPSQSLPSRRSKAAKGFSQGDELSVDSTASRSTGSRVRRQPSRFARGKRDLPVPPQQDETAAGNASEPDHDSYTSPRRVSMPADLPEPQELGLPPRSEEDEALSAEQSESETETLSRRSRSRSNRKGQSNQKEQDSTIGKAYTWALIVGAILLIPATIYVVWYVAFADDGGEGKSQGSSENSEERGGEAEEQKPKSEPVSSLTPLEKNKVGTDHYELSNVDQFEMELKARGECWFQIRNREVSSNSLEDRVLQDGDTFNFTYKEGNELWLEMGLPTNVEVMLNGHQLDTSYDKSKKFHIKLVK